MMRRYLLRMLGVLLASLIGTGVAQASLVQFIFTDTIAGTNIPGVAAGNTLTVTVVADNGGSSLISQAWSLANIVSASASVASYSATWTSGHRAVNGALPVFTTGSAGSVTLDNYLNFGPGKDTFSPTNTSAAVQFVSNTIIASSGGQASFSPIRSTDSSAARWSVSAVPAVPAPAAVWLLGTGLAGLVGRRWLRRKISS